MMNDESWFRRHTLAIVVTVLGLICLAVFTWAEWGYFVDTARAHCQPVSGFWSAEHIHDWVYNAFSNYQSELLFGVLLIVMLHKLAGPQDAEKDDT